MAALVLASTALLLVVLISVELFDLVNFPRK